MRKALCLGVLGGAAICAVCVVVKYRSSQRFFLAKNSGPTVQVLVDPYPIPPGSWVSVMGSNGPLGACIKSLDKQPLGSLHESKSNKDAIQFIKQCPSDQEAWLIGEGLPGEIATAGGESISDLDKADFDGLAAKRLVLFGCWTGALDLGANFVSDLSAHTKHVVWAQNSQLFCVPGDTNSPSSRLYKYRYAKVVEASPEHPQADVAPRDLYQPTPTEILLSDNGDVRRVFPTKVVLTNLARVAHGPFDKKEFVIAEEDRASRTSQFIKTVDFSHPFKADPVGEGAIPLARPVIQVTFEVEGKPRTFTVYGGGLLGDDQHQDIFYQVDLRSFNELSKDLESTYTGLF
jgi:hypothetical protein